MRLPDKEYARIHGGPVFAQPSAASGILLQPTPDCFSIKPEASSGARRARLVRACLASHCTEGRDRWCQGRSLAARIPS